MRINEFFKLKNQLDELKAKERDIRERMEAIELDIITDLENAGLEQARAELGSVTLNTKMYPSVTSDRKQDFITWSVNNGRLDMLIVRPNERSVREFFEETNELPDGVETYIKTKLNTRRA